MGGGVAERLLALAGLVALAPVLLAVAAAIALDDGFPVVYRQSRVGRNGASFLLVKFRSMRRGSGGVRITASGDARLTRCGDFLRRYKLDELLQLWNVVKGDMSLIGPRPEVAEFVDSTDPVWRAVLAVRPGITDLASLVYRNEEEVLAAASDRVRHYREVVLPAKLALNLEYLRRRSLWLDVKLICLTARYSLLPSGFDPERIKRAFSIGAAA